MYLGIRSQFRLDRAIMLDKFHNTKLHEIAFWKIKILLCKNKNTERCKYYTEQLEGLVKLN